MYTYSCSQKLAYTWLTWSTLGVLIMISNKFKFIVQLPCINVKFWVWISLMTYSITLSMNCRLFTGKIIYPTLLKEQSLSYLRSNRPYLRSKWQRRNRRFLYKQPFQNSTETCLCHSSDEYHNVLLKPAIIPLLHWCATHRTHATHRSQRLR